MKTLIFCTGYAPSLKQWEAIHGRWINAVENSELSVDKILIPDDGSPFLPSWAGVDVIDAVLPKEEPVTRGVICRHSSNLGRQSVYVYPGWHRSFILAAQYAQKYGYEKIIHVEADAFIISRQLINYINDFDQGWETFWCPRYQLPETAIQVITGLGLQHLYSLIGVPYSQFSGRPADPGYGQGASWLPYTTVNKHFHGDRWGETHQIPPKNADYACQIPVTMHCWWLDKISVDTACK